MGAFEAARETNRFAFSTDLDKNHLAPDHILASALKDVTRATYLTVTDVMSGTFKGGLAYYDITNGGIGLSPFHGLDSIVPEEVKKAIEEASAGMLSGKIVPPETPEEVPCP